MLKENLNDLQLFWVVAKEGSFTKASALLGVSPSALSHSIKAMETRLGFRLFNRTTRSIALTETGEHLFAIIEPKLTDLDREMQNLHESLNRLTGNIRITATEHAASAILSPLIRSFVAKYPEIKIEVSVNNGFVDIVNERFDGGIRLGEHVEKDMVAVRVGPDFRMIAIASPAYFEKHGKPETPQDLLQHACINLRLSHQGGIYAWEFAEDGKEFKLKVDGQLTCNSVSLIKSAALNGLGIAFLAENFVSDEIKSGELVSVCEAWCPTFTGFHLYYPSAKQHKPAFAKFVEAIRYSTAKK
jgi:Transcriptional regulator